MNKKCEKYESIFLFGTDEQLQKHISQCPDCLAQDLEFQKVSELINEVKPYYKNKSNKFKFAKIACSLLVFILCGTGIGVITTNSDVSDMLNYGQTLSAEQLGFPVDSYGLIMVE